MAESSKTNNQTTKSNESAAPESNQTSQSTKTEEEAEAEVSIKKAEKPEAEPPSAEAEPEKDDEKEEKLSAAEIISTSSTKADAQKLRANYDRGSVFSIRSAYNIVTQQEILVNQLVNEFLPRSLDEISDEELLIIVINLENSIYLMEIENEVLESYIRHVDPTLMEDFNERLECFTTRSRQSVLGRHSSVSMLSRGSVRRDTAFSVLESGPRITLTTKSGILDKETALVEQSLNEFRAKMEYAHADLKAAEEEAGILTQETLEAISRFERMSTYSVDPVTGQIPAEKFVRYMKEWLKIAESTIEKLRLHTNTMHHNIRHMKRLIQECRDLGYTIQPIDFDQMKIENRLLKETLAMKNKHLLELKHLAGKCSLVLVQHKKKLMQQESQEHTLAERIEMEKGKIRKVEKKHEVTKHRLQHAEPKLVNLREFIDTHDCPSVMEYIKMIDEVNRLEQEIHKWERRHGIQNLTLESSHHRSKTSSLQSEVDTSNETSFTSRSDSQEIIEESFM